MSVVDNVSILLFNLTNEYYPCRVCGFLLEVAFEWQAVLGRVNWNIL